MGLLRSVPAACSSQRLFPRVIILYSVPLQQSATRTRDSRAHGEHGDLRLAPRIRGDARPRAAQNLPHGGRQLRSHRYPEHYARQTRALVYLALWWCLVWACRGGVERATNAARFLFLYFYGRPRTSIRFRIRASRLSYFHCSSRRHPGNAAVNSACCRWPGSKWSSPRQGPDLQLRDYASRNVRLHLPCKVLFNSLRLDERLVVWHFMLLRQQFAPGCVYTAV